MYETNTPVRKRKRHITWYNPPYSVHVKKFLGLLNHHFPQTHELRKICNKSTIKLSYSCTNNMAQIIKAHNNELVRKKNIPGKRDAIVDAGICPLLGQLFIVL